MKKSLIALAMLAAAMSLSACGDKEPAPPSTEQLRATALAKSEDNRKLQDLLEQQRSTALANVQTNVANYFAANPRFDSSYKTIAHTDDYIGPACPQGSGWAWASIMKVEGKQVEKRVVWCSTSSSSLGCFIEDDFKKSPHAGQASKCNPDLPHPLKSITR